MSADYEPSLLWPVLLQQKAVFLLMIGQALIYSMRCRAHFELGLGMGGAIGHVAIQLARLLLLTGYFLVV